MSETKICADCDAAKPLSDFYIVKKTGSPYRRCKECHYKRTRAWRAANIETVRENERARYHAGGRFRKINEKRLRKYGLTVADYERLLDEQGGICPICEKTFADSYSGKRGHGAGAGRWDIASIDHDHTTGEVRGILHRRCNLALEFLLSDDELSRAHRYLNRTPAVREVRRVS